MQNDIRKSNSEKYNFFMNSEFISQNYEFNFLNRGMVSILLTPYKKGRAAEINLQPGLKLLSLLNF